MPEDRIVVAKACGETKKLKSGIEGKFPLKKIIKAGNNVA